MQYMLLFLALATPAAPKKLATATIPKITNCFTVKLL